jgi:hypothetical protein
VIRGVQVRLGYVDRKGADAAKCTARSFSP